MKKLLGRNDRLGHSWDFKGWRHVHERTIKWEINSARPVFNGFYALQSYSRSAIHALEMAYTRSEYAIWIFREAVATIIHGVVYTRSLNFREIRTHRWHLFIGIFNKHRRDYLSTIPWLNNIFLEGWKNNNDITFVKILRGKNYVFFFFFAQFGRGKMINENKKLIKSVKTCRGLIGRFPRAVIYSFIRVIASIILQILRFYSNIFVIYFFKDKSVNTPM